MGLTGAAIGAVGGLVAVNLFAYPIAKVGETFGFEGWDYGMGVAVIGPIAGGVIGYYYYI